MGFNFALGFRGIKETDFKEEFEFGNLVLKEFQSGACAFNLVLTGFQKKDTGLFVFFISKGVTKSL